MSSSKLGQASLVAQTITLMGLGNYDQGSGISAAKFLIGQCERLIITDLKSAKALGRQIAEIKKLSVRSKTKIIWHLGGHQKQDFIKTEMVIRNPDVPWYSPFLLLARKKSVPIYNDVTLFLHLFNPRPVIGVTGTRGKSTTTALIYEMIKKDFPRVALAGNIGHSPLLLKKPTEPVVLELSSFLLHDFSQIKYSPNISVWTNFYPDHLNKYHGLKDYFADKANIFKYQKEGDTVILNFDDLKLRELRIKNHESRVWFFSLKKKVKCGAYIDQGWFVFREGGKVERIAKVTETKLLGEHNQANILAAIAAAKAAGVSSPNIAAVIKKWSGLPNRLELAKEIKGVKWFNDCTATSPEAAIAALKSFPARKIILISGGNSKGSDLKELGQTISERVKELILVPGDANDELTTFVMPSAVEASGNIVGRDPLTSPVLVGSARDDNFRPTIAPVLTLAAAVARACQVAKKGDVVLFSPGLTWLPRQNEFARGAEFIRLVER